MLWYCIDLKIRGSCPGSASRLSVPAQRPGSAHVDVDLVNLGAGAAGRRQGDPIGGQAHIGQGPQDPFGIAPRPAGGQRHLCRRAHIRGDRHQIKAGVWLSVEGAADGREQRLLVVHFPLIEADDNQWLPLSDQGGCAAHR